MNIVQNPSMTRISFASRSKFKICLVKGGGMSKSPDLSKSSKSPDLSIKSTLENLPKGSRIVVNVYGKKGSGKTTFFSGIKHIQFDHEILKSKEQTIDFLEMMKYSFTPLVLDDYELVESLPGIKEIKPLKIPVYIVSTEKIVNAEYITTYFEFPGIPVEEFAAKNQITVSIAKELLEKAGGNMRCVKLDLENFKSERDVFMSSKEYIQELIESNGQGIIKYMDRHLSEHGNTLGLIHQNYPDFVTCVQNIDDISQSLSDADLIDMKIYSDVSWDLMHYFNVCACLIPSLYMSKSALLSKSSLLSNEQSSLSNEQGSLPLRPASLWTKMSNMKMKSSRLKKLRMDRDCINVWVAKANAGHDVPFDSYDLDSINQLSLTKIKSRALTLLKKKCRRPLNNETESE